MVGETAGVFTYFEHKQTLNLIKLFITALGPKTQYRTKVGTYITMQFCFLQKFQKSVCLWKK